MCVRIIPGQIDVEKKQSNRPQTFGFSGRAETVVRNLLEILGGPCQPSTRN